MALVLYTGVNNVPNIPYLSNKVTSNDVASSNYVGLSNQGLIDLSSLSLFHQICFLFTTLLHPATVQKLIFSIMTPFLYFSILIAIC